MPDIQNIVETLKGWPGQKKIIFFSVIIVSLASLVMFLSWVQRADYQVLYSNLSESDKGLIVQKMKEMKTPYRIELGNILVPADKVYDLRFQFASQGLPQGGVVGFELFDKTDFGTTDFVQKINYRRALQGELARTISSIMEVEQCRVHLSIPERSLFVKERARPTASVLLKLKQGRSLSPGQVQGVVHLISSSVEGLDPKEVTIVDNRGTMLTRPGDEGMGLNSNQLSYQHRYEKEMEARIIDILEPVVGANKVKAKVTTTIDFARSESTEERYNPDEQVVRSEQKGSEKEISGGNGGIPGVASNLPGKAKRASLPQVLSQRKNETVNYEISKVTTRVTTPSGNVKRLSVAVLVDGVYTKQDGSDEMKYAPRKDEEIKHYEDLVKKTIGFSSERGDEVKVLNMPFQTKQREPFPEMPKYLVPDMVTIAKYVVPLLIALFFFIFVLRPLIKGITVPQGERKAPELPLPQTVAEIEKDMGPRELSSGTALNESKPPKAKVIEWARENPKQAAHLIREWIEEG